MIPRIVVTKGVRLFLNFIKIKSENIGKISLDIVLCHFFQTHKFTRKTGGFHFKVAHKVKLLKGQNPYSSHYIHISDTMIDPFGKPF